MSHLIPTEMTDAAMWAIVVGFFMPIVINLIVSATWSAKAKAAAAFVVSAIAGAGVALFAGAYEGLGIPSVILLTFVVAISAYSQFWKQVAPAAQRGHNVKMSRDEDGTYRAGTIALPTDRGAENGS